ncbi:NUDIX hydrolase [Pseudomonas sp. GCM10022188]|uniref:NUDIX hydrolase n=1 Tax=Pseudomonas TaxID=286 RepID=UPI001E48AED9|nr:NUDIX hydrolase [Pseudomonas oryzagri]MCC6075217.1 NUDIX hydrolase [Pseudomonas oryzagri]
MISIDIVGLRFQVRAAAIFVHDEHVLLHKIESDTFWALPGGRVEPGEDAQATIIREMKEELNESVECTGLLYTVENFFTYSNKPNHEIGLYFQAQFHPKSPLLEKSRSHIGVEGGERLEFRWFPRESLPDLDLHPAFLRECLSKPSLSFQHIVQRG